LQKLVVPAGRSNPPQWYPLPSGPQVFSDWCGWRVPPLASLVSANENNWVLRTTEASPPMTPRVRVRTGDVMHTCSSGSAVRGNRVARRRRSSVAARRRVAGGRGCRRAPAAAVSRSRRSVAGRQPGGQLEGNAPLPGSDRVPVPHNPFTNTRPTATPPAGDVTHATATTVAPSRSRGRSVPGDTGTGPTSFRWSAAPGDGGRGRGDLRLPPFGNQRPRGAHSQTLPSTSPAGDRSRRPPLTLATPWPHNATARRPRLAIFRRGDVPWDSLPTPHGTFSSSVPWCSVAAKGDQRPSTTRTSSWLTPAGGQVYTVSRHLTPSPRETPKKGASRT